MRLKNDWRRRSGRFAAAALAVSIGFILVAGPAWAEGTGAGGGGAAWYASKSPSWWLNLRTTGYTYQSQNAGEPKLDRFGFYQGFDGAVSGLAQGKLTLRLSGRVADDLSLKDKTTDRGRLYVAQLEARPTSNLTARLGRQFLQEGSTGLGLDGLWASWRPSRIWDARVWGGASAPLDRTFSMGKLDEDAAVGARLMANPCRRLKVSGSWAYRERGGVVAARPFGAEGILTPTRCLRLVGKATYDLERELWDREEVVADWHRPGFPTLGLQWLDKRPAIDAASYFTRFEDLYRVRIGRANARYETKQGFGAECEYFGSFVNRETSTRLGVAAVTPYGRVGYSARLGDSGEEDSWYGDLSVRVTPWLRLDGGATFATYALLQDAPESDERDLTTLFGRVHVTPRPGVGVTLEVQNLENPVYSRDTRFLFGIDLLMGRGLSRFGLDRGGWFK